jgi:hypothetical protein
MLRIFSWTFAPLAAAVLAISGCSQGPATGTVTGEVTLDGKPLPKGHLEFTPLDGEGQTGGIMIAEGKFSGPIPVAKMRVKIHAPKPSGKKYKAYDTPDSPWEEDVVEALPARYNDQSDMTLDVKRGSQTVKYELKSK